MNEFYAKQYVSKTQCKQVIRFLVPLWTIVGLSWLMLPYPVSGTLTIASLGATLWQVAYAASQHRKVLVTRYAMHVITPCHQLALSWPHITELLIKSGDGAASDVYVVRTRDALFHLGRVGGFVEEQDMLQTVREAANLDWQTMDRYTPLRT